MGVKRHVVAELEDLQKREECEESNYHTIGGMFRSLTRKSLGKHKKPPKDEFDLHDEDVRTLLISQNNLLLENRMGTQGLE